VYFFFFHLRKKKPFFICPNTFVNEHQRVFGLRFLEALDQLSRHCTNVGTTMTLDLGNIGQATHREAEELAIESLCN